MISYFKKVVINMGENIKTSAFEINRYDVIDYLKENGRSYAPVPEHIIHYIKDAIRKKEKRLYSLICVGMYTILYFSQNEFNSCDLPTKKKYRKFFDADDKTVKKGLDLLEEIGVIVQKYEKRKKVIFVKYPEYINAVKSITLKEKVTTTTTTEQEVKVDYENGSQSIASKKTETETETQRSIVVDLKSKYSDHPHKTTIYNIINKHQNNSDVLDCLDNAVTYTEKARPNNFGAYLNTAVKENWHSNTVEVQRQKTSETDKKEFEDLRQRFLQLDQDQAIDLIKENHSYYNHSLLTKAELTQEEKNILYEDFKKDILNMILYKGLLKRMFR